MGLGFAIATTRVTPRMLLATFRGQLALGFKYKQVKAPAMMQLLLSIKFQLKMCSL
jgi:hypothetical protein